MSERKEATEGTWAGFHKDAAKFSKETEREWELVLPLVTEGIDRWWFDDVARVDAGEINAQGKTIAPHAHVRTAKTQERGIAIAKEIFLGMPAKWAAQFCGIGESTFFEWQAASPGFAELIKRARGARMRSLVKIVRDQAPTTWVAAMTLLERLEFEDFGRTNKVRHSHEGTVAIDVRPMLASPEQLGHIAALEASYEADMSDTPMLPAAED